MAYRLATTDTTMTRGSVSAKTAVPNDGGCRVAANEGCGEVQPMTHSEFVRDQR